MIVKCLYTSGQNLPDNVRFMGETEQTDYFPLSVDMQYQVHGLMFYPGRVDFLVCPDNNGPMWVLSNFFKIVDDEFPLGWGGISTSCCEGYSELYENYGIFYISGYLKLVRSYSHYIGLLERNSEDLKYFFSLN